MDNKEQLLELKHKLVDNLSSYYLKFDLMDCDYKNCLNVINHLTDLSMTNKMMLGLFYKWLLVGGTEKLEIIFNLSKVNGCFFLLDYVNSKGVYHEYKYISK